MIKKPFNCGDDRINKMKNSEFCELNSVNFKNLIQLKRAGGKGKCQGYTIHYLELNYAEFFVSN